MQRIHNWKELHLCHPPGERRYIHIDSLFSTQVERELIEPIATETEPKSAPQISEAMRQNSAQKRGPRHSEQAPRRYSAAHRVSSADDAPADFLVRSILGRPVSVNHREFLALFIILHS
jgi:hypothetical protein